MLIFIGSSLEAVKLKNSPVDRVAGWILAAGHTPLRWDGIGTFLPGTYVMRRILEICGDVDAAVFIYDEADKVWYRGDMTGQPRDNVLLELGAFSSRAGLERSIICRQGRPKIASDLNGVTYLDLNWADAEPRFRVWLQSIAATPKPPCALDENAALKLALTEVSWELTSPKGERVTLYEIVKNKVEEKTFQCWTFVSARAFMESIDQEYEFTEDIYWWLIVLGILRFRDIEQFWAGNCVWTNSVDFAQLSERGIQFFTHVQRQRVFLEP